MTAVAEKTEIPGFEMPGVCESIEFWDQDGRLVTVEIQPDDSPFAGLNHRRIPWSQVRQDVQQHRPTQGIFHFTTVVCDTKMTVVMESRLFQALARAIQRTTVDSQNTGC